MLLLSAADVKDCLSMAGAIAAVKTGFASFSSGQTPAPLRTTLDVPGRGVVGLMPVLVPTAEHGGSDLIVVKTVTFFRGNRNLGLPSVHGLATVLDGGTGRPLALVDAGGLTALRTGAAAGLATDLLARPESSSLALIGCGAVAQAAYRAVSAVRPIRSVWLFDVDGARVEGLTREIEGGNEEAPRAARPSAHPVPDADTAVRHADVVVTATSSPEPVFSGASVAPGTHINAFGATHPACREMPGDVVAKSRVYVDSRAACLAEAGDLLIPLREGLLPPTFEPAEIGELVSGLVAGRRSDAEITLFKSVGLAVQDGFVVAAVLAGARRQGLGCEFEL